MSRLTVSNAFELFDVIADQSLIARKCAERAVIMLYAPDNWVKTFVDTVKVTCCRFNDTTAGIDKADQITALLGTEHHCVVYSIGHRLDLGLLAASVGTIPLGGVLVLHFERTLSSACVARPQGADDNSSDPLVRKTTAHACDLYLKLIRETFPDLSTPRALYRLLSLHATFYKDIQPPTVQVDVKPTLHDKGPHQVLNHTRIQADHMPDLPPKHAANHLATTANLHYKANFHSGPSEISKRKSSGSTPGSTEQSDNNDAKPHKNLACAAGPTENQFARQEQDNALDDIISHIEVNDSCCILITGDRGRGKSALLAGIATWLDETGIDFLVSANHRSALTSFYRHYRGSDGRGSGGRVAKGKGSTERFLASQQIAVGSQSCSALLVDEASNWSLKQLQDCLQKYKILVFCATLDGYETAGRAFKLRFAEHILSLNQDCLRVQLSHPWRWHQADSLERFMNQLTLKHLPYALRHDHPRASGTYDDPEALICRQIGSDELVANETLLFQVYRLLQDNHYQSSLKDLNHLLDTDTLQVWIQQTNSRIVSALLLEFEGPIDPSLHEAIMSKQRRLHHQLLPQLLAVNAGSSNSLFCRFARVIRIAVSPEFRRMGFASALVATIEKALMAEDSGVDAMGANFASDSVSEAFWTANGYRKCHYGKRINPRTGTRSVTMVKAWKPSIQSTCNYLERQLAYKSAPLKSCSGQ